MKTLRQTCAVTILSLTLAVSVLAGHMDTTGSPAPATEPNPTPNASTTSTTTNIVLIIVNVIYP